MKKYIFGPFLAIFAQIWANGSFADKSGSVTFLVFWTINLIQNIRAYLHAELNLQDSPVQQHAMETIITNKHNNNKQQFLKCFHGNCCNYG